MKAKDIFDLIEENQSLKDSPEVQLAARKLTEAYREIIYLKRETKKRIGELEKFLSSESSSVNIHDGPTFYKWLCEATERYFDAFHEIVRFVNRLGYNNELSSKMHVAATNLWKNLEEK